jgi:quercetin dioxygenase-like cupin family protein
MAQDPLEADPKHYKVEVENEQVRVLRIRYGPGEKSVIHGHPASMGVYLTDAHVRFTFPDGKTEEVRVKAGEALSYPSCEHLPENLSGQPLELVFFECKGKA